MRTILILISIFSTLRFSTAQNYQPMAVEGATWIYNTTGSNESTMSFDQYFSGYHIAGDSIINGMAYKKLYNLTLTNDNEGNLNLSISSENLFALIRDDVSDRKVYAQFVLQPSLPLGVNGSDCIEYFNNATEYLIYDFSLMSGDIIADCAMNEWTVEIIENIEAYEINTTQHLPYNYEILGNIGDLFYNSSIIIATGGYNRELDKYGILDDLNDLQITLDQIHPTYYPMVSEGATWLYKEELFGFPESLKYEGLHISGDSTINGVDYKIMHKVNTEINSDNTINYLSSYPFILIREDLENRKVYTYGSPENLVDFCYDTTFIERDYLLYDFQHIVNDTIIQCGNSTLTHKGRSNVHLFGFNSNRHLIGASDERFERFGQFYDFFFSYGILLTGETPNRNLVAYCITDEIGCPYIHESPNSTANELFSQSISIYPNPATSHFYISSTENQISNIKLYNLNGHFIEKYDDTKEKNLKVNISSKVSTGLYLLEIISKQGNYTLKKIMIINE